MRSTWASLKMFAMEGLFLARWSVGSPGAGGSHAAGGVASGPSCCAVLVGRFSRGRVVVVRSWCAPFLQAVGRAALRRLARMGSRESYSAMRWRRVVPVTTQSEARLVEIASTTLDALTADPEEGAGLTGTPERSMARR